MQKLFGRAFVKRIYFNEVGQYAQWLKAIPLSGLERAKQALHGFRCIRAVCDDVFE